MRVAIKEVIRVQAAAFLANPISNCRSIYTYKRYSAFNNEGRKELINSISMRRSNELKVGHSFDGM